MHWNALLKGHGSDRNIGGRVHEMWDLSDPRRDLVKPTSLGVMVGQLHNGNDRWWRRPENAGARAALAEVLKTDESDLFPNLGQEHLGEWGFPEFPTLRALNPKDDVLVTASLVRYGSWNPPVLKDISAVGILPSGPAWFEVPDGCGKSFTMRLAKVRYEQFIKQFITSETLMDAALQLRKGTTALIEVRARTPADDLPALEAIARHGKVTVLAPFARPGRHADDGFGEPSVASDAALVPRPRDPNVQQWSDWHWVPDASARRDLVRWACTRVPDTSLLTEGADPVLAWLDEIDSDAVSFGKPADVLWLLNCVHAAGLPAIKRRGFAGLTASFIEQRATELQSTEPGMAAWLRDTGEATLKHICVNRWHDVSLPLHGSLAQSAWARLAPDERMAPDIEELRREIEAQSEVEAIVAKFDRPRPEVVVSRLKRARLLAGPSDDELTLGPPWLAAFLDRAAARLDLERPGACEWGRLSYSAERRAVIDEELLLLGRDPSDLQAHLLRLPEFASTPAEMAAIDAWFVVVGRLYIKEQDPGVPLAALHRLAMAEMSMLVHFYRGSSWLVPPPRLLGVGRRDFHEWLACGWAWSLMISKPDMELRSILAWVFPGWAAPPLETIARDLPLHGTYEPKFLSWIAQFAVDRPNEVPADDADPVVWTAWVLGRLYIGNAIADAAVLPTSKQNQGAALVFARGGMVRTAGPQRWNTTTVAAYVLSWPEDVRKRAVRLLVDAVLLRATPVAAGFDEWHEGPCLELRNAALKLLTDAEIADAILAPGGYAAGDVERLIRLLPARFHLHVIQAVAKIAKSDLTFIRSGTAVDIALAPEAMEWLALNTDWPMARSWAEKQSARALTWLMQGGLSHPLTEHMLLALQPEVLGDALAWAETLPRGEHDSLLSWWALYAMAARPDLVDRWWALRTKTGGMEGPEAV